MKATIYTVEGKETGSTDLPEKVFGVKKNDTLLHQVVHALMANQRPSVAHTKGRGEVRGGGKKPWKQKGTGRARHGSRRSPLWRGGGTTHGPRAEKNYTQKINRTMAARALAVALSDKAITNKLMLVDALAFKAPKTKDARAVLNSLGSVKGFGEVATRRRNAVLFALAHKNGTVEKSFRNMKNTCVIEARNLTVLDILKYRYLIVVDPEVSLEVLRKRVGA